MRSTELIADSIGKAFGDRRVLTSARLEAVAGEITVVAGRNGSGKSTLMKICAGALKPDSGWIELGGRRLLQMRQCDAARFGMFYMPDRLIFLQSRTIDSQLQAMSLRFDGLRVEEVAEALDIGEILDRTPLEVSGGELRRCEVALGLIRRPRCFIADEPLRGIDPKDRDLILKAFRMCADAGAAVVISGHETSELLDGADSVVWVHAGSTSHLGPGHHARRDEQFCRNYLTGRWN